MQRLKIMPIYCGNTATICRDTTLLKFREAYLSKLRKCVLTVQAATSIPLRGISPDYDISAARMKQSAGAGVKVKLVKQ